VEVAKSSDKPLDACVEAVGQLAQRYSWSLLSQADWALQANLHLQQNDASDPTRAAMLAYSHALHAACSGLSGPAALEQAYGELAGYFSASARRMPSHSKDAVQIALERTYERIGQCRIPGAFLAFAFQQLLEAARSLRRQDLLFERAVGAQLAQHGGIAPDTADALIRAELRVQVARLLDSYLSRHPRASQQIAALRLRHIDGLDDTAIAARLGVTIANVYVLRSRGAQKLRQEPEWRILAAEYDLLLEDDATGEVQEDSF
jgi:RNA polymerase sigma factor (sigma-70 family)